MLSPIAAPSDTSVSSGTQTVRIVRDRSRPVISTTTMPPSSAMSGDRPAQSMYGP